MAPTTDGSRAGTIFERPCGAEWTGVAWLWWRCPPSEAATWPCTASYGRWSALRWNAATDRPAEAGDAHRGERRRTQLRGRGSGPATAGAPRLHRQPGDLGAVPT